MPKNTDIECCKGCSLLATCKKNPNRQPVKDDGHAACFVQAKPALSKNQERCAYGDGAGINGYSHSQMRILGGYK